MRGTNARRRTRSEVSRPKAVIGQWQLRVRDPSNGCRSCPRPAAVGQLRKFRSSKSALGSGRSAKFRGMTHEGCVTEPRERGSGRVHRVWSDTNAAVNILLCSESGRTNMARGPHAGKVSGGGHGSVRISQRGNHRFCRIRGIQEISSRYDSSVRRPLSHAGGHNGSARRRMDTEAVGHPRISRCRND